MDVDHIDDNPFNNSIDNLQLLTHKKNLRKRIVSRNQYTYNLSTEEILAKRKQKEKEKKAISDRQKEINRLKDQLKRVTNLWHREVKDGNRLGVCYAKELMSATKERLKILRREKRNEN